MTDVSFQIPSLAEIGKGGLKRQGYRADLVSTARRRRIRAVNAGCKYLPPEVANTVALHAVDDTLSEREIATLRLVAEGKATKEIARRLSLSEDTVKTHLKNIFEKLDVGDRTHAVTVAVRRGTSVY